LKPGIETASLKSRRLVLPSKDNNGEAIKRGFGVITRESCEQAGTTVCLIPQTIALDYPPFSRLKKIGMLIDHYGVNIFALLEEQITSAKNAL
jgi:hypothetical protein